MASLSCAVCCSFAAAADELAPTDTLCVLCLQRLRLRRAAASCLDTIAEEDDSDVDDVPGSLPPASPAPPSTVDRLCWCRSWIG
jgi:hypothetical protein